MNIVFVTYIDATKYTLEHLQWIDWYDVLKSLPRCQTLLKYFKQ